MTNPTAPSDADLIARLRDGDWHMRYAHDPDVRLAADRIDALSARLAEVEWQRDRAEAELKGAYHGAKTLRGWLDRAEQCIEQVAVAMLDGDVSRAVDTLAAYDAARETPEGV